MSSRVSHTKPAGAACLSCPGRDAKCVLPRAARMVGRTQLAIVGEGPGRHEVAQGEPFVGASGRMLQRGLRTIGIGRDAVHWTNAVLCDVSKDDLVQARKQCAKRLATELTEVAPVVTMPVGALGLQSALGRTKKTPIQKWRGSITPTENVGLVMPTVHPAFVMRSPAWGPVLELDVARVGRLLERGGEWLPLELSRDTVYVKDEAQLLRALSALRDNVPCGFDVETVGLGPVTTRLVCFALSDGDLTVVVPWATHNDGLKDWWSNPPGVAAAVTRCLASRVAVTHNGPAFDHIVAARYGIHVARWDDTLLLAHATASHLPKNLAHVVTQHLDVGPWKQWESRNSSLEELWTYNARDTLYTVLAWHAMRGTST